jgi:hypothetical protein
MLYAARNPDHPDHEEFKEYLDPDWDPEAFYREAVNVCLKSAFEPRKTPSTKKTTKGWAPTLDQA